MKIKKTIVIILLLFTVTFLSCSNTNFDSKNEIEDATGGETAVNSMFLTIDGNKVKVDLAKNTCAAALVDTLAKGDIVYYANDYGGFEKVGDIGHNLPTDIEQIKSVSGDVMLYGSSNIVIFYGTNTWSYTKLGKIAGYTATEIKTFLGIGKKEIKISLK